jgi:hypothetical protein
MNLTLVMLRAGKYVLVEKPLATGAAEALAMVEAAEQAGVKFMVDFHMHTVLRRHAWRAASGGLRALGHGKSADFRLVSHDRRASMSFKSRTLADARS